MSFIGALASLSRCKRLVHDELVLSDGVVEQADGTSEGRAQAAAAATVRRVPGMSGRRLRRQPVPLTAGLRPRSRT